MKVKSLSRVRLLATSWTAAYQAPPSMGFSRQEYWSGVPLPSPYKHLRVQINSYLPNPHIANMSKLLISWFLFFNEGPEVMSPSLKFEELFLKKRERRKKDGF